MTRAPVAPKRPLIVTVAGYLVLGAAAVWGWAVIATLFALPHYRRHYADLDQDPLSGEAAAGVVRVVVGAALVPVGLAVLLALRDRRGAVGARVISWVFTLLAAGVTAGLVLADPFVAGWHRTGTTIAAATGTLLIAASAVLLGRPEPRRFVDETHRARLAHLELLRTTTRSPYAVIRQPWPPPPAVPPPG